MTADNAMYLNDFMEAWGRHRGLSALDILDAVRVHMFHDTDPVSLRFAPSMTMLGI